MNCFRLLGAVLLVATPSLLAQSTRPEPSSTSPQPAPVFRSGLELVRVDVRVTDRDGHPIADLRPDEVQIKEEGTPRPVLLFQHIEAPQGTYAEAAQRTIAAQVSTNQGSPRGHVYVFVFDETHILPGHEQRARRAAEHFLRTRMRPGDRVALYALPGPGPHVDFTADVSRVLRDLTSVRGAAEQTGTGALSALAPMRTYEAYEIVRGNQQILDRLTNEVSQNLLASDTRSTSRTRSSAAAVYDDPAENRRVLTEDARSLVARADGDARRFLMAFADVIRALRMVDGRKTVLLFSEGFPIDNVTHELEDVAAAAAQSSSVVYAMDLNPRTVEANEDAPRGGEQTTETRDKLQSLGSITAATAGTLINDAPAQLDRALAQIAEATEDYYLVGFAPGAGSGDRDRYRRIQVIVTRPGARVSARTGFALNPSTTPADRRRTIDAALRAPFTQQGLRVEYTTYTLRGAVPGTERVIVSLTAELPVASTGTAEADVVYIVRNVPTGEVAASGSDRIALPQTTQDSGARTGIGVYRVQLSLRPGTYLMRAVVREPGGLLGSADRRFQVRALDGPDTTASDLVLGSSSEAGLPVRATAYVSDLLTGVFELYGRTESQLRDLAVTTDLVPVDGGSASLSTRAELQPIRARDDGASRGVRVELPLASVTPGQYLVRATVRNGSDTITELLRDVIVRAGARPPAAGAPVSSARFEPLDVLQGAVARQLVEAIQARARGRTIEAAAGLAVSGNWSAVEATLGSAASGSADESILRGMAAFARSDYQRAIAAFRAAQDAGATDAALSFVLGWAHAAAGDDRPAITAWRTAILTDSSLVSAYLALVEAYVRLGQPDLARQVVKNGLRALPNSPELLDRLARLQEHK